MAQDVILVIDAGTTQIRAMVFDSRFRVAASAYRPYQNIYAGPLLVEQDPEVWFRAMIEAVRECLAIHPEKAHVAAVIVASQRATVVPVDKEGQALTHAILWQDSRCLPQCRQINDAIGESAIHARTGLRVSPYFSLPKILWIKENNPAVYQKTFKFLMVHDYLLMRLTGRFLTDQTHASRTMAYNLNRFWDRDILRETGLDEDRFCEAVPSGSLAGSISASTGAMMGLPAGTPVLAGAGDQPCAAVGLGAVKKGGVSVNTGTGSFVISPTDRPVWDPDRRILSTLSALPDQWALEAGMYTTGSVYRWFRDQFGEGSTYPQLDEEASRAPAGSSGVLWIPHFTGSLAPYWDPLAKGVLFNLSLATTRAEIIRAILEGIAIEINKNITIIKEIFGNIDEISTSGGPAKSPLFNRIQADVYGSRVVTTQCTEATSLGAAIIAETALQWHATVGAAVEKAVRVKTVDEPNPDNHSLYTEAGKMHDALYHALQQGKIYERS